MNGISKEGLIDLLQKAKTCLIKLLLMKESRNIVQSLREKIPGLDKDKNYSSEDNRSETPMMSEKIDKESTMAPPQATFTNL